MGGPNHTKGVLILGGFLAGRYLPDLPLSLSASLVLEQNYGGVEGDSASSAELYALLSALAEVPIRQSFAVTGSVNQHGEVQAIGGVNEKIEGFFDLCARRGLTGEQGVLIPKSNVPHLMLRKDVVAAAEAGRFRVFPVETIDEGIELLTGLPAGERGRDGRFPETSVNARVEARLSAFAKAARASDEAGGEREGEDVRSPPHPRRPRRLPGEPCGAGGGGEARNLHRGRPLRTLRRGRRAPPAGRAAVRPRNRSRRRECSGGSTRPTSNGDSAWRPRGRRDAAGGHREIGSDVVLPRRPRTGHPGASGRGPRGGRRRDGKEKRLRARRAPAGRDSPQPDRERLEAPILVGGLQGLSAGPVVVISARRAGVPEEALGFVTLLARAFGATEVVVIAGERGAGPSRAGTGGPLASVAVAFRRSRRET